MSLRYVLCFFIIQIFSINLLATNNSHEKQVSASDQDMNSVDLTFASGHYSLESGKAGSCPDGEFTGGDGFLVVGAHQRIAHINKGPQITDKECHEVREAKFYRKNLDFTQLEDCGEDSVHKLIYSFRFYQTPSKAYIDLNIKSSSHSGNGVKALSSLPCLYSRSL